MRVEFFKVLIFGGVVGVGMVEGLKIRLVEDLPVLITLYTQPSYTGPELVIRGIYDGCYNTLPLEESQNPSVTKPSAEKGKPWEIKSVILGPDSLRCELFTARECEWDLVKERGRGSVTKLVIDKDLMGIGNGFEGVGSLRCEKPWQDDV